MLVRTETQGSNSWVMIGFTYAELVERIGCSEVHVRKVVSESNGFKIEKGTRGKNGKPAIVWMSEPKLKSFIQDMILNHVTEMKGEKRGRMTGDSSSCDLYSNFKSVEDKVELFKGQKPKKRVYMFDKENIYELDDIFYATDGTVCKVIEALQSNFFVSKVDGQFGKVSRYHRMCGEQIIQSTKGELFALKDVYFVEISKDGSTINPIWLKKSRKDPCIIGVEE